MRVDVSKRSRASAALQPRKGGSSQRSEDDAASLLMESGGFRVHGYATAEDFHAQAACCPDFVTAPLLQDRSDLGMTILTKIVLVEDEAFQRQVIAECLAQHGLRPTTLASGAELKRLAQHAMPDLALLDVHLNE